LHLRPATEADRDALGALKLRSSLAWGDLTEEIAALPEAREVAAELLAMTSVVETEGRIAGFVTVLRKGDHGAELEELFVEPGDWGRGLGRLLMEDAVRRAEAFGARSIEVVANARALGFYATCGFAVIGEVATQLEPAPLMRRAL
jgi:GNAT superfamily N-acetyltransferase